MDYIYETHLHTDKGSACSDTPGAEYVQKYMDAGYSGIIITDHYFRGNCAVPKELPWEERVNRFCRGYEETAEEGYKRNFSVFFGWEERIHWDEYLVYGLDKKFMLAHPEMESWTAADQIREVRAAGGCVVQAHPFRAAWYITDMVLHADCVDGIEGYNAGNHPEWNALALRYAERLGLPVTGGSDNHHAATMENDKLSGIVLKEPLREIGDLVRIIREKKPIGLHTPAGLPVWEKGMQPELPAVLYGAGDRFVTDHPADYLDGKDFPGLLP